MNKKRQVIDALNQCKISFSKIEKETGVSRWTILRIANMDTENPSYDDIEALHKFLSTPPIEQKDND